MEADADGNLGDRLDIAAAAAALADEVILSAERMGWLVPLRQVLQTEAELKAFFIVWLSGKTEPPFPL